jgi:hypothetical protein
VFDISHMAPLGIVVCRFAQFNTNLHEVSFIFICINTVNADDSPSEAF